MAEQAELLPDDGVDDTLELLLHADSEDLPRHVWPKQLADLVDVLCAMYRRRGRTDEQAFAEAREVVLVVSHYAGGKPLYLAKGETLQAALRHARIWRAWKGDNAYELADQEGLTLRQIQNIIKDQMRYRRGLRQVALPFERD